MINKKKKHIIDNNIKNTEWCTSPTFKNLSSKIWFPKDFNDNDKKSNFVYDFNGGIVNKQINFDFIVNTDVETNNNYKKHINIIKTKQTYSEKHPIFFNKSQIEIILKWFVECNKVYNEAVKRLNIKLNTNYKSLKMEIFRDLYGNNKKGCPYDILTDEVRIACSNMKSCLTNIRNKNIKHFTLTERTVFRRQSILIPKKSITKNGIFPNLLGKQQLNFNVDTVEGDSRLLYDYKTKHFMLNIVRKREQTINNNKQSVVSIDPGEKTFATFYSHENCGKIGEDIHKYILYVRHKISKLERVFKQNKNKNDKTIKHKKQLRLKINKMYEKIQNIVKEMHNKTAIFLCKNYDTIILPKFGTAKMVKKERIEKSKISKEIVKNKIKTLGKEELKEYTKRRKINRTVAYILNTQSHYKFRQHLINKSNEYGCQVKIVTEEYTSMCCGNCGHLSKKYSNRIKECDKCNTTVDRDINGARNILIKNYVLKKDVNPIN